MAEPSGIPNAGSAQASSASAPWWSRLFQPVDIASLIYFRVTFGLLMFIDIAGYTISGHLHRKWVEPTFRFEYYGFDWVPMLSGEAFYFLAAVQMAAALGVMAGVLYRWSAIALCLSITWFFLFDQSNYQNHHYLICLISAVAIFLPAHRSHSWDVQRRPELRSDVAPAWPLWLLRAQMGIAYFYAGLAKLHADWFQGAPVSIWFAERAHYPVIGPWLNTEAAIRLVSYGGVFFDLLVVPFLLWRRTRFWAFLAAVGFHLANATIFSIGIFPFLSIALTVLFFTPATHRKLVSLFERKKKSRKKRAPALNMHQPAFQWRRPVLVCLGLYLAWQMLMPFRHFLYPGNANWTEEGHRFAWHMMLRRKAATAEFIIRHQNPEYAWKVSAQDYLTDWQYRKMAYHPDMILQFAHHIAADLQGKGHTNFTVHALAFASLNGRPPTMLIDPSVDLAREPRNLRSAAWILPLGNRASLPPAIFTTNTVPPRLPMPGNQR